MGSGGLGFAACTEAGGRGVLQQAGLPAAGDPSAVPWGEISQAWLDPAPTHLLLLPTSMWKAGSGKGFPSRLSVLWRKPPHPWPALTILPDTHVPQLVITREHPSTAYRRRGQCASSAANAGSSRSVSPTFQRLWEDKAGHQDPLPGRGCAGVLSGGCL